ncbi:MAG: hypothetical protein KGJ10_01975 [Acidobacteriota bacterium]|nr:hypothetical protein [Acidobacteriota bacterium]MDE3043579.1 hypothetical protein [Acidobacteriota bacterium]MDE3107366.1 hypothetical protein [Acidobacteriota bacterium]MDE3222585.1 hypothetical protein [Acidobacteriota bacterium]
MGLPGMVISGVSAVIGAIMYWAVTAQSSNVVQNHGFRLSTVGVILLIAGVVGFVVSALIFASSRRGVRPAPHSVIRETTDSSGNATVLHEEQR